MTGAQVGQGPAGASLLLRAALLAGLFEGIAIARYQVLQADLGSLPAALGFVGLSVLLHGAIWWVLGQLAASRFGPVGAFRTALLIWTMAVVVGRSLLADRLPGGVWLPALAGVAVPAIVPARFWSAVSNRLGAALAASGVLLVGTTSLLGLVPDVSHPRPQIAFFLATSALLAIAVRHLALRWPRSAVASAAMLAAAGAGWGFVSSVPAGPNVLFVLLDTTRYDHVPPFGDTVHEQTVTWLARQGVRFEQAVTVVPKTPGSVASNWTGLYPSRHGVRGLYDRLGDHQPTLAELFRRAGYRTAGLIDNGWLTRGRGFGQGFERFSGYYEVTSPYGAFGEVSWWRFVDQLTVRRVPRFSAQVRARRLTDAALGELDRIGDDPFFLYVHYFEPHWPYFPPPEKALLYEAPPDGRTMVNFAPQMGLSRGRMIFDNPLPEAENEKARRLYRAEVDDTLGEVRRLIEGLDARGLGPGTIVVFTADHGHSLGEHDYYFHHGEFLYDDSVRVPLVVRWPDRIPAGRVVSSQVRSIDVAPTLLQLADIRSPGALDGRSLERFWDEAEIESDLPVLIESDVKMFGENRRRDLGGVVGKLRAIRTSSRKLILNPRRDGFRYELYDLAGDPDELLDLSGDPNYESELRELTRRLWAMIPDAERDELVAVARAGLGLEGESDGNEVDLDMLRSLGYIN